MRFEATAVPFMRTVYSRAFSLTGKPETAADLTQDTYLRAYRTFHTFTPGTNCRAWLLTILYSIFVNRYHRKQLEPESMPVEEIEGRFRRAVADETESRTGDPSSWASEEVARALERLPASFRTVLLMVDVDDWSARCSRRQSRHFLHHRSCASMTASASTSMSEDEQPSSSGPRDQFSAFWPVMPGRERCWTSPMQRR